MSLIRLILDLIGQILRTILSPFSKMFGGAAQLKVGEQHKKLVMLVAIVVIVGSVISLFVTQCERPPKINLKPYVAVGEVAAEETAKLLANQGEVVIVTLDTGGFNNPAGNAQLDAFTSRLNSLGGIRITAEEKIQPAMSEGGIPGPEMGLSATRFLEIVEKYPDVSAIVSFLGIPYLQDADIAKLPQKLPKFVGVSGFGFGMKKLFDEGIVQLAIVPRFQPPSQDEATPKTPKEWFDRYYQVVTPDSAGDLPY